jgi:hypothetical protein
MLSVLVTLHILFSSTQFSLKFKVIKLTTLILLPYSILCMYIAGPFYTKSLHLNWIEFKEKEYIFFMLYARGKTRLNIHFL